MRTWQRPWLATVVLLAALGAGARPCAASLTAPDAGSDGVILVAGEPAAAPAERIESTAASLALVRPTGSFLAEAQAGDPDGPLASIFGRRGPRAPREPRAAAVPSALGAERARILLRSLTLPGWGQATLGRRTSAVFFGLTEAAVWGTFTAFRMQVAMREDAYLRTARLRAGIDLGGRDDEWRRIVGSFISSEEYNLLVVARDAANLYYDDPAAYRAYIAEHALAGADAWSWGSLEEQTRYRDQRKSAQRAVQRANTTLAVAVVNRIVSALHAARAAGRPAAAPHAWQLEVVPAASEDPTAFQFRVRARF